MVRASLALEGRKVALELVEVGWVSMADRMLSTWSGFGQGRRVLEREVKPGWVEAGLLIVVLGRYCCE